MLCDWAGAEHGEKISATEEIFLKIEEVMGKQVAIHCNGDFVLVSGRQAPLNIRLVLNRGHYDVRQNPERPGTRHITTKEKPLVVTRISDTPDMADLYSRDESVPKQIDIQTYREYLSDQYKAPYVMVRGRTAPGEKTFSAEKNLLELEQARKDLAPLGLDLFRLGTYKNFALELYRIHTLALPKILPLTDIEDDVISGCGDRKARLGALRGGLVYVNPKIRKKTKLEAVSLDVTSMYPSIMCSSLLLPLDQATPKKVSKYTPACGVGYYSAKVAVPFKNRCLWLGAAGYAYYTHIDLQLATLLDSTIEMEDVSINAYVYPVAARRVQAAAVYSGFVNPLMDLKQKGVKSAKKVLNILWGAQCERRRERIILRPDEEVELPHSGVTSGGWFKNGTIYLNMSPDSGRRFLTHGGLAAPRWSAFITARAPVWKWLSMSWP